MQRFYLLSKKTVEVIKAKTKKNYGQNKRVKQSTSVYSRYPTWPRASNITNYWSLVTHNSTCFTHTHKSAFVQWL